MTAAVQTQPTSQAKMFPWWLVLIEGIAAVILGLMFFMWPAKTTVVLVPLIGLYWMFDGMFSIVSIFVDKSAWGWKLFMGIVGILAGWFLFTSPIIGAFTLASAFVWVLAFMGIFAGIAKILQAFQGAGWGPGFLGVLMIVLGALLMNSLLSAPLLTAAIVPFVAGGFLVVFGGAAIFMAFKLKT